MTSLSYNKLVHRDFERALGKAFWRDRISWLTRKNNNLLPSDQLRQGMPFKEEHCLGLQRVPPGPNRRQHGALPRLRPRFLPSAAPSPRPLG